MKALALVGAAGAAICATASGATIIGVGGGGSILDNTTTTSTINISAPGESVVGVRIDFGGLEHTWVGDLIMTLTHVPTNTSRTFLDRPGSPATFFGNSDDFARANSYGWADGGTPFPENSGTGTIGSGVYAPGQGPGGVGLTFASAFGGLKATGNWRLSISDNAGGDTGQWQNWTLTLNTVPLPTGAGLAAAGLMALAGIRRRR